ncbi:MAG: ABC transporter ATP-binding protein, partial [Thermomicrobiales bacterium]
LRFNTRTEIKRLQRELGTTTIFVTHDQEEAMVLSDRIAVMSDGVLQQFSTPDETYRRPANRFVAGFIGSPRMNFLKGRMAVENGVAMLQTDEFEMGVPGIHALTVAATANTGVVVGIRPEHLRLSLDTSSGTPGEIELLEPVGPVTYADVRLGSGSVRASLPGDHKLSAGQAVGVNFEPDQAHFFDEKTGARISE